MRAAWTDSRERTVSQVASIPAPLVTYSQAARTAHGRQGACGGSGTLAAASRMAWERAAYQAGGSGRLSVTSFSATEM